MGWVSYQKAINTLTKTKSDIRLVRGHARFLTSGIAAEPPRIVYSLSRGAIIGNTGIIYHQKTRFAITESTHCWIIPPHYHPVLLAPRVPPPILCKVYH